MAWSRRKLSEGNLYHITIRGVGRQLIFEDDDDCRRFLDLMRKLLGTGDLELAAWRLMGNHAHLLLHADLAHVSVFMRKLGQSYAWYFNKRHDRVGHLMQGRYGSVPIEGDAQLMQTVRYIHLNPSEAGFGEASEYPWSSYRDYLGAGDGLAETAFVLGVFGGVEKFVEFHSRAKEFSMVESQSCSLPRMTDGQALQELQEVLKVAELPAVPYEDKATRNAVLVELRRRGLSIRQIERLTGIGRGIIARAGTRM